MARVVTKRSYMDFVLTAALSLGVAIVLEPQTLHAEATYPLSYSGRLTLPGGEPMQGPVDIELRFWNAVTGGAALSDPFPFAAVPLNQGVFQVRIPTTSDDVAAVFGDGSKTVFIEVTAKGVTYPRQEFTFVPLALRVPVDKGTVDFGTDGKLKVLIPARTSSDTVLSVDAQGKFTWEPLAVGNLQTKPVSQQPPTSGQVLTYDGSQWTPKTLTQGGSAPVDLTAEVSGVLPIAKGGTGTNLGSSGGAGQYLKQSTAGGAVTVGTIAASDITQSLGFVPVNRAGDTLGGGLSAGGFDITSTGNIQMAQSKTFGLSANATDPTSGLTAADKGKTWFNSGSGQIKYWDGTSALALAVAGTGISSVTQGTGISTGTASGTATITLANTTVVPGSYSRANITVDAQGRLSGAVSGAAILDSDVAANAAIAQSKISGLTTALSAKEGLVATGTSSQYWRGDKSWQELTTAAVAESGTSLYFNDARARGVLSATAPATYSLVSGAIGMTQSGAGSDGYLSSTDWNMFSAKQNALGYTPLNKAGDTLSGLLNAGGFDISNTGNIQLAAAKTLGFGVFGTDPTGLTASDKGKIWFNASTLQVKYWDGSSAVALGVSGSGLSSLNGQTGNTQTFAPPGTSGLAPAWSSAANAHTLNIPMASAANVTAGLLANTDYTAFANKISNVTQGSGIAVATASGTATVSLATAGTVGTYALITTDAYGRVSSGTTLSASDIPPLNASAITSGMLPVANGGTGAATLATGNVILGNGTNAVQTVAAGTSGNVLTSNGTTWQSLALPATNWAAPGAVGSSTPNSGDFTSITSNSQAGYKAKPFGGLTGNTGEVQFAELSANGTNYVGFKAPDVIGANKVWILPATDGSPGQVLKTDGAGNLGWSSDGGGTVTNVTVTSPLAVSNGTSVPALSLSQATGSTNGYLTSTDWTAFNTKQAGGNYVTALTGDVSTSGFSSGTATATLASVALGGTSTKVTYDVKGRVSSGTTLEAADLPPHGASLITSGAIAVANGGTGLTSLPGNGQIPIGNGTGYTLGTLSAGTGISISNSAGGVTVSSTVDTSTKVSKQGDTMTGGLSLPANGLVAGTNQLVLAGGNIGIGTTSPQRALDINGTLGNSSGDISLLAASGHRLNISGSSSYAQLVPADNTIGNPIYYEVHNQGTGQGSPNGLRMGISGANFNGVAYLDTFNGGVAVATPLALKTQGTERLRIDTNGNVGIGTINPVAMLHVNGSIVGNGSLSSSGGDFTFMDGGVSDSTATRLFSGSGNLYLQNGSGGNTYFRSKTASTLVTIQNSGNVGIGTTNPNQKLSVAGTVESTAGGFKFPDGTTQTTAAIVKYCSQTGTRSGAAGTYNFTFVAADCGGSLPDTNYKGAAAEVGICNGVATFKVLQPGDANGPGVSIYSNLGPCGGYTMGVLYLRVN